MQVAVVLDPEFDNQDLFRLASKMPVWIVDTPANRKAAEQHWTSAIAPSNRNDPSLTVFHDNQARRSNLSSALSSIEEHHDVTDLVVFSSADGPALRTVCEQFGFSNIETLPGGFRCAKSL
jgi:hypothetical protein